MRGKLTKKAGGDDPITGSSPPASVFSLISSPSISLRPAGLGYEEMSGFLRFPGLLRDALRMRLRVLVTTAAHQHAATPSEPT